MADISLETLQNTIGADRIEQIEFQPANIELLELAESLMSLANRGISAWLVFGAENNPFRIQGVTNTQFLTDRIYEAARQVVPALVHIIGLEKFELDGKILVAVSLPANLPGVYHVAGRYLRQRGSQRLPIGAEELLHLLHSRGSNYYEDQPVPGATLSDIDRRRIEWYIAQREQRRNSFLAREMPVEEFLDKLGLLQTGYPSIAAVLFFGHEPQRFFPYHVIRAMRFADKTTARIVDRVDIGGTIPEMIEQTLAFVQKNTRHPVRFEGALRYDEDEYPAEAIREAIANACVHRDMSVTNGQLRVFIFSDRILVDSPGDLLPGVQIEKLSQISRLRNPRLAQLLYDSGYMERAGTGINRMIRAMQEQKLVAPIFEEVANSLQVTLPGPDYGKVITVATELKAELNSRQQRFLSLLQEQEQMNRKEYETYFKVSERTANNDLLQLVRKGLIVAIGSSVKTVYRLKMLN